MRPWYAIRHVPTGFFMPEPTGRAGRGSSYWEPIAQASHIRLFRFERSAKAALTQWLRGKHKAEMDYEFDEWSGKDFAYQAGTSVEPVPSRIWEDMEIVTFDLVERK